MRLGGVTWDFPTLTLVVNLDLGRDLGLIDLALGLVELTWDFQFYFSFILTSLGFLSYYVLSCCSELSLCSCDR